MVLKCETNFHLTLSRPCRSSDSFQRFSSFFLLIRTYWHKLKNDVFYLIHGIPLCDNDNDVSFQKCIDSAIVKFFNKLHKKSTTPKYYLRQLSSTNISQVQSSMSCLCQIELTIQSIQCFVKDGQGQQKQPTIHGETSIRYWQRTMSVENQTFCSTLSSVTSHQKYSLHLQY